MGFNENYYYLKDNEVWIKPYLANAQDKKRMKQGNFYNTYQKALVAQKKGADENTNQQKTNRAKQSTH